MAEMSFSEKLESPVAAARLFKAWVLDSTNLMPKIMPDVVLSGTFVGDGGPGSIKQYNLSKLMPYSVIKDRLDMVDKENLANRYTLIEGGGLGEILASYTAHAKFEPLGNGGCICEMGAEYKFVDGVDCTKEMENMKGQLMGAYKAVEAYLLANPDAYA
eukprot:TRINITY_DN7983_c0_g2_i1.p1 TRINITY_DN7983_c0_g2~~TRINITY_DN7983_c0_g2_i1.p1  ORF type:complete len:159 (-),score=16.49 TRINITY_DN7983_c0_g2_i1:209-685(-)